MNKIGVFFLFVVIASVAVEANLLTSWHKKIQDLEHKFARHVQKKADAAISKVRSAEAAFASGTKHFFENSEHNIKTTIEEAIEDLEVLKNDETLKCYEDATKVLLSIEVEAIADLLNCRNMSKASEDILDLVKASAGIVQDVVEDAKLIVEGVAECGTKIALQKWECICAYIAKEVEQLVSQWPEVKTFGRTAEKLGEDIVHQVKSCLTTAHHQELEKKIKEAISTFNTCAKKQMSAINHIIV